MVKLIEVKGRIIGGESPNVCFPLVGKTEEELIAECSDVVNVRPDIVEWRVDYYNNVENIEKVEHTLRAIRQVVPDYPIIFTCRAAQEGGVMEIELRTRVNLLRMAARTELADIVDIETISGRDAVNEVIGEAHKNNVYGIVSYHNFTATPSKEVIIGKLIEAQQLGADIAKIAVMPDNLRDVLTLLEATLEFKEKYAQIPAITMSMSGKGLISRTAGFMFGSAVTFGAGKQTSAPGQISIPELKTSIDILLKYL